MPRRDVVDSGDAIIRKSGLPPVVGPDPQFLVLGSFPSASSLEKGEYYANPRNQFFAIIEELFSIKRDSPYQARISALKERHIALWDVIQSCTRQGSSDTHIRNALPNDLTSFFAEHPGIRIVAMNGKKAALYSPHVRKAWARTPPIKIFVLQSSSPANTRYSLEEKTLQWRKILTA